MLRQTIHNVTDFKISEPKLLSGYDSTYTRTLLIENDEGETMEITLFTDKDRETLLPKRMKED